MLSSTLGSSDMVTGAAILGVLSHLTIFIRGEWHMQAPAMVVIYTLLTVIIFYIHNLTLNFYPSLTATTIVISSYVTALFTSMVVYRKYFHRLRHYPGPWMAGATKFWHVWQCRTGQNHLVIENLVEKYGPLIRTGPEELTYVDPAVRPGVDGPGSSCTKAVWYDFLLPEVAVNTTRSKRDHDARRRIWDRGFSSKALAAYDERIIEYAEKLVTRIQRSADTDTPMNVSKWFHWFTFDIMGEFAFARSFDMLENEEWHHAVNLLRKAMSLLGPFSPVPWLAQIGFYLTPWMYIVRDWFSLMQWCKKRMSERIEMDEERPDVSQWLIDAARKKGSLEADREWLNGDAFAIVIAGSDTIALTLICTFYELARNPSQQQKLLDELHGVDLYNRAQLQSCAHLNAVINETLRLHPPVPTGGYRQSPPGGISIGGTYIPGNITIVSPSYSLGRLESSYKSAHEWIPERWTTQPDMVKDARGFAPFSQGRFGCVGKALALNELRLVVAMLVTKFHVEFADAADQGKELFENMKDQFTAAPGKLDLRFKTRSS